tara:strand:+ start:60599 stop:61798 length:1200 start_codon:yes stop_codon:yes gene_type:complete
MWRHSLKSRDEAHHAPIVVSLNAWESDYWGDPLFAIISGLVDELDSLDLPTGGLKGAVRDFGWFATAIGSQVVAKVAGIDPIAAGGFAQQKRDEHEVRGQLFPDSFTVYRQRKNAMEALKQELIALVGDSEPKAWFLVDELDRCRPDYAITYLETIKHIFDMQGAVFILAADRLHLENSAKTAFGRDLNFDEYYRKFIHREVRLPPISDDGYIKMSRSYVAHYLEREGERFSRINLKDDQAEKISHFIGALRLTPRQVQEVFRILGHICAGPEDSRGRLLWCLGIASLLMSALKIGKPDIYRKLGSQSMDADEMLNFLRTKADDHVVEWWFSIILTGGGLTKSEDESEEDVMVRVGYCDSEGEYIGRDLGAYRQGWGFAGGQGRIRKIHNMIEGVEQWQ